MKRATKISKLFFLRFLLHVQRDSKVSVMQERRARSTFSTIVQRSRSGADEVWEVEHLLVLHNLLDEIPYMVDLKNRLFRRVGA